MAAKKTKKDMSEKIAMWESCIQVLKDSIRDQAAQVASGTVDLESSEFLVILECMELNRRQIASYRSLLEEADNK